MSKNKGSWSMALVETMKDPLYRVISSELAVVIKDKYPKAKYHFLVLPYENIPTPFHVSNKQNNSTRNCRKVSVSVDFFRTTSQSDGRT